jgi:nicotinamidase-related amidase
MSKEVKRTGRQKLIMAGLWTDFRIVPSAIQAIESGYEVYVVSDACGDLSARAQDAAIRRMVQAGAKSIECQQVLAELQQHEPLRMPGVHHSISDRKRRFL